MNLAEPVTFAPLSAKTYAEFFTRNSGKVLRRKSNGSRNWHPSDALVFLFTVIL